MSMEWGTQKGKGSIIDPLYSSGRFLDHSTGEKDAEYKVSEAKEILEQHLEALSKIGLVADVGCGLGKTTFFLQKELSRLGYKNTEVIGYDIHPMVDKFAGNEKVSFVMGDFLELASEKQFDLVALFDVVEHVLDPINFINKIAQKTRWVVFHIPMDNSFLTWIRNLPHAKLEHPGHLIVLDTPTALNIITFAGLRIVDFSFSPVFLAPSGKTTRAQRLLNPLRHILFHVSPYLLQKTLGGVSLTVLARSPLDWT